jgi:hypothetical protein
MKKVMNKNKAAFIALAAVFCTAFTSPASAMDKKSDPPGMEIKYIGFRENNPVFEINLNNSQTDNFIITIRDENGALLYTEKLTGKNLSRTYRIDTEEEIAEGGLRFEVRSVNSKKTEVYIAGINEKITRQMAVNKIQ